MFNSATLALCKSRNNQPSKTSLQESHQRQTLIEVIDLEGTCQGIALNAVFLNPKLLQNYFSVLGVLLFWARGQGKPLPRTPTLRSHGFARSNPPQQLGWVDVSSHPVTCTGGLGKRQGVLLSLLLIYYSRCLSSRNLGQIRSPSPNGLGRERGCWCRASAGQAEALCWAQTPRHPREHPLWGGCSPGAAGAEPVPVGLCKLKPRFLCGMNSVQISTSALCTLIVVTSCRLPRRCLKSRGEGCLPASYAHQLAPTPPCLHICLDEGSGAWIRTAACGCFSRQRFCA